MKRQEASVCNQGTQIPLKIWITLSETPKRPILRSDPGAHVSLKVKCYRIIKRSNCFIEQGT